MKIVSFEECGRLQDEELDQMYDRIVQRLPHSYSDFDWRKSASDPANKLRPENISDPEERELVLRLWLKEAEKLHFYQTVERMFCDTTHQHWYDSNSKLRDEVIEYLIKQFDRKKLWHEKYLDEKAYQAMMDPIIRMDYHSAVRCGIGFALRVLIKPSLKSHREKYLPEITRLLKDRSLGFGRLELVVPYSRMGKQDVAEDLLGMLDDSEILQTVIPAVGRLKRKVAIPKLEEIVRGEGYWREMEWGTVDIHKDLARRAIRSLKKTGK